MNMSISTAPATAGSASASGSASGSASTTSNASAGGFSGALIQAIGGGSNTSTVVGSMNLPVGLVGVLSQFGLEPSEDQSQDLLELIAKLVEQLDELEQGNGIPREAENQLAALVATLQGFIQQLGQSQTDVTDYQMKAPDAALVSQLIETSIPKPVLQELRENLQKLAALVVEGKDEDKATAFAGQLKALLDTLELPQVTAPADEHAPTNGQQASEKSVKAAIGTKAADSSDHSVSVSKEALTQTAAIVQEVKRPVLRDPIWRFNVEATMENTATDGQTAIVPTAVASEQASDSNSQQAWTLLRNDAAASTESALAKPMLPAQVPVQQFAQQIEKFLVKQFLLTQGNGTTEAKLTLNPEHLGQVDIRIIMQNGQVTAQFMTDNVMARDLLDNQMSQLRSALNGQGLQVDRLEVVQQSSASSNTSFMQQEHRHSNSGNQGNGSNGRGKDGLYEDPAQFAAELERSSSLREFGFGSSLNVTA